MKKDEEEVKKVRYSHCCEGREMKDVREEKEGRRAVREGRKGRRAVKERRKKRLDEKEEIEK